MECLVRTMRLTDYIHQPAGDDDDLYYTDHADAPATQGWMILVFAYVWRIVPAASAFLVGRLGYLHA